MGHFIAPDETDTIFGTSRSLDYFYWDQANEESSSSSNTRPSHSSNTPTQATDLSEEPSLASTMPSTAQLTVPPTPALQHKEGGPTESSSKDLTKAVLRPTSATMQCDKSGILFTASMQNIANVKSKQIYSWASTEGQNGACPLPKLPVSLPLVDTATSGTQSAEVRAPSADLRTSVAKLGTLSAELKTLSAKLRTTSAEFRTPYAKLETLAAVFKTPSAELRTSSSDLKTPSRAPRAPSSQPISNSGTTAPVKGPLTPTKTFLPLHTLSPQHTKLLSVPPTSLALATSEPTEKEDVEEEEEEEDVAPCDPTAPGLIPESESWGELGVRVAAVLPGKLGPAWYDSHTGLMNCDNALPRVWRLYIALVALCRHEVSWAARLLALEFLKAGGKSQWLTSYTHAPAKLQKVMTLNTLLAHQPWALTVTHVQELCCDGGEDNSAWSYSEAMLSALLLSHHHSLAAFLLCCPLLLPPPAATTTPAPLTITSPKRATTDEEEYPESDEEEDGIGLDGFIGLTFNLTSNSSSVSSSPSRGSVLSACSTLSSPDLAISSNNKTVEGMPPQHSLTANGVKVARFGSGTSVSSRPASPILPLSSTAPVTSAATSKPTTATHQPSNRSQSLQSPEEGVTAHPRLSAAVFPGLLRDLDVGYKHFPHHLSDENSTCISGTSYRWIDYGFDCTRQLLGEECLASELDDRFSASSELGERTSVLGEMLSERRISGPCHKAVWRQVQWLLGVLHEDYDYRLLRRTMPRNLHHLIRTATCFPRRLSSMTRPDLQQHEVIAVCAQIMDVRMQCEVMFAVRAITRFYTTNTSDYPTNTD